MKLLHILKTPPDNTTDKLIESLSEGKEVTRFNLYEESVDYEELIDLIFSHDHVISWW